MLLLTLSLRLLLTLGGIRRFYSGIIPALIQGPICLFGDTFSNAIILNILSNYRIPIFIKTGIASTTAGLIRIVLSIQKMEQYCYGYIIQKENLIHLL